MKHTILVIAAIALHAFPALGHQLNADHSRLDRCPPAVRTTLLAETRGKVVDELEIVRIGGRSIYIAEVERPTELKIYVDESGTLIKVREEIDAGSLPAAVRRTLDAEGGRIDDIEREIREGDVVYLVELDQAGGVDVRMRISPDGKVAERSEGHDG